MSDNLRDEELTRLYRKAAEATPPPELDRVILDAARAGIARGPERKRAWWQRWTAPVAAFATIVLTVMLTLMVQQEREHIEQAPAMLTPEKTARPPTPPPPAAAVEQRQADRAIAATAARAPEAAAPAKKLKEAEALSGPRPFASEMKESVAEPRQRREAESAGALSAPAALPAASPARPDAESLQMRAPAADSVENRAKAAPLRKQESRAPDGQRSPEAWIEEIRQLKKQGREKDAQDALEAFRRAYPDHGLPEDLR